MGELVIVVATCIVTGIVITWRVSQEVLLHRRRKVLRRSLVTGLVINLLILGLVESIAIPIRQFQGASEYTRVGYITRIESATMEGVSGAIGPVEVSKLTIANGSRPSSRSTYLVEKDLASRFQIGQKVEMHCNRKPGEYPARSVQEICIPKAA